jgi:23S rRNA (cytidine1920-2'-O)/16S rRNA (cytidine1409-2'-O)-methyltransferase
LNKKGIVKQQSLYGKLEEDIKSYFKDQGLKVEDYFKSPIQGGDGNTEFFIYASRT